MDGEPVPLREVDTTAGVSAAGLDQPVFSVIPPRTLTIQVSRLQIDRGVFDIRIYARGPRGPAVCLGGCCCLTLMPLTRCLLLSLGMRSCCDTSSLPVGLRVH